jgi:hypothetical protein
MDGNNQPTPQISNKIQNIGRVLVFILYLIVLPCCLAHLIGCARKDGLAVKFHVLVDVF